MLKKYYLTFVLLLFIVFPYSAQDTAQPEQAPTSLDKYLFVARGKMARNRGINPLQIARLDNNGEILFRCVDPKSIDQLKTLGIEFQLSQLELLTDWDLLAYNRKNKTYKTTVHIYGPQKAAAIRKLVSTAVIQLTAELAPKLTELKNHLKKTQHTKSLFAILYGYVLHSYAMEQFGPEIYQKPQLSAEKPFWNGFSWAVFPIKKFNTAVTCLPVAEHEIFSVSAATVPRLQFQQLLTLAKDVVPDYRIDDPELKKSLSDCQIFNAQGRLTIPIFDIEQTEKLLQMAKKVYAKTIELVESAEMKNLLGMATQAQAAMYIHYELRHAFLHLLLQNGTMILPADLEKADLNSRADIRNLIFLIQPARSKK